MQVKNPNIIIPIIKAINPNDNNSFVYHWKNIWSEWVISDKTDEQFCKDYDIIPSGLAKRIKSGEWKKIDMCDLETLKARGFSKYPRIIQHLYATHTDTDAVFCDTYNLKPSTFNNMKLKHKFVKLYNTGEIVIAKPEYSTSPIIQKIMEQFTDILNKDVDVKTLTKKDMYEISQAKQGKFLFGLLEKFDALLMGDTYSVQDVAILDKLMDIYKKFRDASKEQLEYDSEIKSKAEIIFHESLNRRKQLK